MDRRLLVLALGMFALGTDSFVVAGVLPEISQFFTVPISAAGQTTTIYAVTYALLAPTIAALAAGVPRKTLLLAGLALFILANLATAASPTFPIALATRIDLCRNSRRHVRTYGHRCGNHDRSSGTAR